jgi:hypothetical protein
MATENNKNITYPKQKDLFKRQKVVLNTTIKNTLYSKISNFVTALKAKHS